MEKEFNEIAEKIMNSELKLDNDDLLILYGYYKQSTIGDCNINKPFFFDTKGTAKYDAWIANNGMKKELAMKRYIRKANMHLK